MQKNKKNFISTAKRPKIPIWPIVFSMEAFTSDPMKKIFGDKCDKVLMTIQNGTCEYFLYKEDIARLGKLLLNKIEKNPQTTKKYIKMLLSRGDNILSFAKNINTSVSDKIISQHLKTYDRLYKELIVLGWPLAVIGEEILTKEIKKYLAQKIGSSKEREKIFEIISTPSFIPYTTKEEIALLKLALKYKTFDKAGKFLKKHSDKYQWICFDYVGPSHDYVYFAQRLKLLFKKPLNTLAADLQKITEKPKKIKLKTRNTAKKYNFPKSILKKIDALQDLIYIRDKKKEFFTEVHFNMEALLDKIQVLTKIEKKCLRWLTTKELIAAIKGNKIELKNIQKRIKYSAVLTKNGKTNILLSKKAKKYFDLVSPKIANIKHLKGMCGCSGKINGKVRVIGKIDDGYKLNKGEILVTTMTTIDFVPIIKKAAAIVTDEGGVTSHAAVISREFKIPSVIGARIATQILKDGDLVEVDADKGIVKILK